MSNLLYLVLAILISLIGSLILWARSRQPRSMDSGIEQFSRELKALAPETELPQGRGRRERPQPGLSGRERQPGLHGPQRQQGERRSG